MSKNSDDTQLKISGAELCFAGQALGIPRLLLPADPFQGWFIEDIDKEFSRVEKKLLEKELLGSDQKISSSTLSQIVEILGNPHSSIILQQEQINGDSGVIYFHGKEDQWVALEMIEEDQYQIEKIAQTQNLDQQIDELIILKVEANDQKLSIQIKYEDYFQAREAAQDQGLPACQEYLQNITQEPEISALISEDLANPRISGSVTEWHWQDMDVLQRKGLAFLGGEERLWLVKEDPKDSSKIQLTQITRSDLTTEIAEMVDQLS